MTPDRYRQVKELFWAALERPTSERAAFLGSACSDDGSLLQAVKDLLAHHDDQEEPSASQPSHVCGRTLFLRYPKRSNPTHPASSA